jgi:hypothetical protein
MSKNSHQSLPDVHKDIWFEILKVCEPNLLYSMYLVNKLFQQIIEDMELLPPFRIFSMMFPIRCEDSRQNLESSTTDFFNHHKLLQRTKHYELKFLTHEELMELFNNSKFSTMINMLEIDIPYIVYSQYNHQSIIEKVLQFPNITMLSLVGATLIPNDFLEACSKNPFLQYLNLRNGTWYSFMNFSKCSFVNLSLDNMNCINGTSIEMPCCLKKCYLNCSLYCSLVEAELPPNSSIKIQMSHCKELKTL